MTRTLLPLAALLAAGCAEGPYPAPYWADLVVGNDVSLAATTAYGDQDNEGTLVLGDVMVVDSRDDAPMTGILVEIMSQSSGVYVLPEEAVKLVDYPEAGDLGYDPDPADVEAACDTDGDGYIDADAEDWCSWYWDEDSGNYYQFGSGYADADYRPTYMTGGTDERGVLRFYVYVDAMPATGIGDDGATEYSPASIWVSIQVDSDTFMIMAE